MSDEKALLQHLACVVPESSWFFRGHLQHVAEYLSRAGLALVPAAEVQALADARRQLVEDKLDSVVTRAERAVLKECEKLSESDLLDMTSDDYYAPTYAHDLGQAIIAWKAAKEAK